VCDPFRSGRETGDGIQNLRGTSFFARACTAPEPLVTLNYHVALQIATVQIFRAI
jgi:hypothetical protein